MSTSVASVVSHFPEAENGFTTTLASTISSGATTVPLNSVAGYTNGMPAVFVVDPADPVKKQTFTGIIDTSGVQVTSVVWTAGTNQSHSGGATVVDYATATHIAMMSKGILIHADQDGTLKAGAVDNAAVLASDVVTTAKILDGNVTAAKIVGLDKSLLTTDSNPYKVSAYRNGTQTVSASTLTKIQLNAEDFDSNNNFDSATNYRYTAPVAGFWQFNARVANNGNGAIFLTIYKNGSEFRDGQLTTIATGRSAVVYSDLIQLAATDYIELYVYSDNTTIVGTTTYDTARLSGFLVSRT